MLVRSSFLLRSKTASGDNERLEHTMASEVLPYRRGDHAAAEFTVSTPSSHNVLPSHLSSSAGNSIDATTVLSNGPTVDAVTGVPHCKHPLLVRDHAFNTGLFACGDDLPSAVEAATLPCCLVARQYNMLLTQEPSIDITCCMLMTACSMCTPPCMPLLCGAVYVRSLGRERLDLRDEIDVFDCIKVLLFPLCSIAQLHREMAIRDVWPRSMCAEEAPYAAIKQSVWLTPPLTPVMGGLAGAPPLDYTHHQSPQAANPFATEVAL